MPSSALPAALWHDPSIGLALLWTGLVTTALTRVGESSGLARVPSADAAVIVATEPLWAVSLQLVQNPKSRDDP